LTPKSLYVIIIQNYLYLRRWNAREKVKISVLKSKNFTLEKFILYDRIYTQLILGYEDKERKSSDI